jgi:SAM-dependent methyltransferase
MLQEYYNRRAPEYEEKYYRDEPVRQAEQAAMAEAVREAFVGRQVLEVACGTGFWTAVVAEVAKHVVATDTSPEMLALARVKGIAPEKVEFCEGDAYALESVPGEFDAGLANFWFSHVQKAQIGRFLKGFHSRIGAGAVAFMADDVYLPGVGGEFVEPAGSDDTYKRRELRDGTEYVIVKNYYDKEALNSVFAPYADDLQIHVGTCFWWVKYYVRTLEG